METVKDFENDTSEYKVNKHMFLYFLKSIQMIRKNHPHPKGGEGKF